MNGWVKLHKKILDNDIFRHDRTAWHVFETLLILANTKTGEWSGGMYQLSELVGEGKPTVYKAILRLEKAGMINRLVNSQYTVYNLSNWNKYQSDGKQPVNTKYTTGNTLKRNRNKDIEKDSSKELAKAEYGSPEINKLFDYWQATTGYPITADVTKNRRAGNNLIKKYGEEKLHRLIAGVAMAQGQEFAPQIASLVELQSKADKLVVWGKGKFNKPKGVKL